ncbi:hypothetical protein QCA50_018196 [Cerrena zonata]|uniref:Letm1 RBD domain-containing protein n=1 Tax=Cerrena zonata TaxID=2478898 RepID=A0AAW0FDL0_9APHY
MGSLFTKNAKNGFFLLPQSKSIFESQVNSSQLLSALWHKSKNVDQITVNSPTTLPVDIKPKTVIHREVAMANPDKKGFALSVKQLTAYAKSLLSFYKNGVVNVWKNKSAMNRIKKSDYKLTGHLNTKGEDADIRIPSFAKLTSDMAQALYISKVENETVKDGSQTVVKNGQPERIVDEHMFNITRRDYQLLKRTSIDFIKLPAFAVIIMIFAEVTPILCYWIPEITPLTCVLPSLIPRVWSPKATIQLRDSRLEENTQHSLQDLALKNAYNLPLKDVRLICQALRLVSKYVPISIYPEPVLRRRLQDYYCYLKVDNYYLSGLNGKASGNIWNLSNQELVLAALERNIILDIESETKRYEELAEETAKTAEMNKYFDELRLKLLHFIIDFENYNVGYLGVNHLVEDPADFETVMEWRRKD